MHDSGLAAGGRTFRVDNFFHGAGEKGRRIRELTSVVQKRFNFPAESVELYAEKVADRGLCAVAQAESLRYKLLGGLAVRRCVPCTAFGLLLHAACTACKHDGARRMDHELESSLLELAAEAQL